MPLLLIFISSLLLSALGVAGLSVFRRGHSWLALGLLILLLLLPLGVYLPGLSWNAPHTAAESGSNFAWLYFGAILWIIGVIIGFVKILINTRSYHRWARTAKPISNSQHLALLDQVCERAGVKIAPTLALSHNLSSPVIGGFRSPTLYLPKGYEQWDTKTLEMVFWHEIGHLVRKDLGKQLFGQITQALYWFNPLLRNLQKALSAHCELACDAWVIRKGVSRKTYLEALCNVAESAGENPTKQFALSMADHVSLSERVRTLVHGSTKKKPIIVSLFLTVLATLSLTIVSLETKGQTPSSSEIELRLSANPFPMD